MAECCYTPSPQRRAMARLYRTSDIITTFFQLSKNTVLLSLRESACGHRSNLRSRKWYLFQNFRLLRPPAASLAMTHGYALPAPMKKPLNFLSIVKEQVQWFACSGYCSGFECSGYPLQAESQNHYESASCFLRGFLSLVDSFSKYLSINLDKTKCREFSPFTRRDLSRDCHPAKTSTLLSFGFWTDSGRIAKGTLQNISRK